MVHVNEFLSQKRAIFELKLCKKKIQLKQKHGYGEQKGKQ